MQELKKLRQVKKQFVEETFSIKDLRRFGLSKEQIDAIPSIDRYDMTRYSRQVVWDYINCTKSVPSGVKS